MSLTIWPWAPSVSRHLVPRTNSGYLPIIAHICCVYLQSVPLALNTSFGIYCWTVSCIFSFSNHNQFFAAFHSILISDAFFSEEFAVHRSTASTYISDERWLSYLRPYSDCVVNRGNECSKALPAQLQSAHRGETSYSMRVVRKQ